MIPCWINLYSRKRFEHSCKKPAGMDEKHIRLVDPCTVVLPLRCACSYRVCGISNQRTLEEKGHHQRLMSSVKTLEWEALVDDAGQFFIHYLSTRCTGASLWICSRLWLVSASTVKTSVYIRGCSTVDRLQSHGLPRQIPSKLVKGE